MTELKYREIKPLGKCSVCTINLWAEHDGGPTPKAAPCVVAGCPHKSNAKMLTFERSTTGSSLAQIEG